MPSVVKEAMGNKWLLNGHMGLHHLKPRQNTVDKDDGRPQKRESKNKEVLAVVYSNNPDSYEIAGLILGLSQNEHGQAISFKAMGRVSFSIQLENKHAFARDATAAKKRFFNKISVEANRFTRLHKFFNTSVNSQITDTPGFEQKMTKAVPDCVGCFTARVTPAIPRPHVLIDDNACMVKLIRLNTASTAIQMGQYYMDLVH